jgi:hypothetical protein
MQPEKFVSAFNPHSPLVTRLRSVPRRAGAIANPVDDMKKEMLIATEIETAIKEIQALYSTAVTPLPQRSAVQSDEPAGWAKSKGSEIHDYFFLSGIADQPLWLLSK